MKSGHVGVYAHEQGPAHARRISPTSGRVYYSQVNLRQLYGPSIAKEVLKPPIPADFKTTVLANSEPRLTHELERMIAAPILVDRMTKKDSFMSAVFGVLIFCPPLLILVFLLFWRAPK
jgi:hypothetical protein